MRIRRLVSSCAVACVVASLPSFARAESSAEGPDAVPIHFDAEPGTILGVESGTAIAYGMAFRHVGPQELLVITHVCSAPCDAHLPAGPHHFALLRGRRLALVEEPVSIQGPSTIHGTYESRAGTRWAGAGVLLVATGGGIALSLYGLGASETCTTTTTGTSSCHRSASAPLVTTGLVVALAGSVVAAFMMTRRDRAFVTVTPLVLPATNASLPADVGVRRFFDVSGLALVGAF